MDNHRVGSLNSLADYGRGESDIEDSDDEIDTEEGRFQPRSSFSVYTQSRVKLSKSRRYRISRIASMIIEKRAL